MKNTTNTNNKAADAMQPAYNWNDTLAKIAELYTSPVNRTKEQIADDDAYSLAEYTCLTSATQKERDEFYMEQINYKNDPIYREIPDGSRARKH